MVFITDYHSTMSTTTPGGTSVGEEEREYGHFSVLHIILIAFGGVVFIIGIVVIIILLKSRRKLGSAGRGAASNGRHVGQPPIFVIGQGGNRQGRGGDNPAFSRSDETNNSAVPSRGQMTHATTRLPTYEEVMSGRVPSAPLSRSQQRSNIRVSQLQYQRGSTTTATNTTTTPNVADSSPRMSQRCETPPPRYAYEYPSCFWEEVPPPPYPSGNYGIVRAMGGPRGSTRSVEERPPQPLAHTTVTVHRNYSSPNPGRAPLAVPTPTVLSPAPSPAVLPRNHTLTSSGRRGAIPPTGAPPSPFLPALSGSEVTRPLASSSPAVPRRQPTPVPAPVPIHGLTAGVAQNSLHSGVSGSRSAEVRGQGQRSGCHGSVSGPVQTTSAAAVVASSAPLARFDIEL